MTHPRIRPATTDDTGLVAGLITTAFHDLTVCGWIEPDPAARTAVFQEFFRLWVDHALTGGTVEVIDDPLADGLAACAVWFDLDGHPHPPPDYPDWLAGLPAPLGERFTALDRFMEHAHPTGAPHHYLLFLAVARPWQNTGLGSALLNHHHRALDQAGLPAYLESASARSRPLYQRHGYRTTGHPFTTPGQPTLFPMWRKPIPRATTHPSRDPRPRGTSGHLESS